MTPWTDLFGIDPDYDTLTEEPQQLLAVVEEKGERHRRWFRWSYNSHTCAPWQLMGAVHVDDEEKDHSRWSDLPKVRLISDGVPVCGCSSCGGPRPDPRHEGKSPEAWLFDEDVSQPGADQ